MKITKNNTMEVHLNEDWKEIVDKSIQEDVIKYLTNV